MPIHLAITRRVRAGCESEFERAVREFFQQSFGPGIRGVHLLTPPPGSDSREYGILRTFASETEREAFYASPGFRQWQEKVAPLTEGDPTRRQLHGLELWFRGAPRPPRWKMALVTFAGVYVVTLGLAFLLSPLIRLLPPILSNAIFNAAVVVLLTWVVMPVLIRFLRRWLEPS